MKAFETPVVEVKKFSVEDICAESSVIVTDAPTEAPTPAPTPACPENTALPCIGD